MRLPIIRFQSSVAALLAVSVMWPVGAAHRITVNGATPNAEITACPVTPYAAEILDPTFSAVWYGSGDLWAAPDGSDRGVWFSAPQPAKVQWRRPAGTPLTIEGRRLDAPSPPLIADITDGYDIMPYQFTPITFPTPGCWEITGEIPGAELRFVVLVHPGEEHYREIPLPAPDPAVWDTLRRPPITPALEADGSCPQSPDREISRVRGAVLGDGPSYVQLAVGIENPPPGDPGTTIVPLRWIMSPDAVGPILIRGLPIGGAVARFGTQDPLAEPQREDRRALETRDWQIWFAALSLSGPGCYAVQIDGPAFSQTIVIDISA